MCEKLIYPLGFKLGCNRRKSRFGQVCKTAEDGIETIPRDQWNELIGLVSLRNNVHVVLDQGSAGSCATESTTQGVMIVRDVARLPFELLNPWSIYHFTSGGRDNGSSIDENLVHARDYGVLSESYWPRSKGWKADPPSDWKAHAAPFQIDEFFDIATEEELGSAVLKGYAVVFGSSGHSCIITSLLSDSKAAYCNSWDESWGDHGYGTIALRSINWSYGSFAIRLATSDGGTPVPPPTV